MLLFTSMRILRLLLRNFMQNFCYYLQLILCFLKFKIYFFDDQGPSSGPSCRHIGHSTNKQPEKTGLSMALTMDMGSYSVLKINPSKQLLYSFLIHDLVFDSIASNLNYNLECICVVKYGHLP